jgi:DNA-binding transcriptional MerR regulator
MGRDEVEQRGLSPEASPAEERLPELKTIDELARALEREISVEDREKIDTEVRERTIPNFRGSALRRISLEAGWLETNVNLMTFSLDSFEQSRHEEGSYWQALGALQIVGAVRQVQISLAEIKMHIAEYRSATRLARDSEPESEALTQAFAQIEEYIRKTEEMLKSPQIVEAGKIIESNVGEVAELTKLPSYAEARQPLPLPMSLVEKQIDSLRSDMFPSAKLAFQGVDTEHPPSTLVRKVFSKIAYRDLAGIRILKEIQQQHE